MSNRFIRSIGYIICCAAALVIMLAMFAVSWIFTCGIIKLITICFGWTFNWLISTGIWWLTILVTMMFNCTIAVKK